MGRNMLKRIGVILLIVFATITFALLYKWFTGTHIRHYKQYILQCRGRISTSANSPTRVRFYVLDEKEISELSNKENISEIFLITNKGERLSCDDWSISGNVNFYSAGTYAGKELNVVLSVKEEVVIEKVEIIYADAKELFNIGSLTIEPMLLSEPAARTQIVSYVSGSANENFLFDESMDYHVLEKSYLYINANTLGSTYRIKQVELGIEGLGIAPLTLKEVPVNMDFGQSFLLDEANKAYLSANIVEELPEPKVDLYVESSGNQFTCAIIGFVKTKEYDNVMAINYISPVFTCLDEGTGTEYRYASMEYMMDSPIITGEEYVKKLLEEYGR